MPHWFAVCLVVLALVAPIADCESQWDTGW